MTDRIYGLTDTGKHRSNNEDTFIAQPTKDGRYIIACVIDGVGGYSGGEIAAALTREVILDQLAKPDGDPITSLTDSFHLANQKIIAQKAEVHEYESMACVATLTLIDLTNNEFYYVHVGDTRLYLLRDGSLIKISHDQSFVGYLEESGRISEQEAMAHPKRNEINKALGFDADMAKHDQYMEAGRSPFLPGDRLLVCSDGLTDMVPTANISKVMTSGYSLKTQCERLVAMANDKGGLDNITVVLAANDKEQGKYDATRPALNRKVKEISAEAKLGVQETPATRDEEQITNERSGPTNWLVIALGLLTLAFLAGNVWQYFNNKQTTTVVAEALPAMDSSVVDPMQIRLEQNIAQLSGNTLLLSDSIYTSPIVVSREIPIDRDTLFIKTKGKINMIADSGYNGAALKLSSKCRLVMLDSLVIKGFKTGIIAYNRALRLNNVRFERCEVTVQNLLTLADTVPSNR